MAYINPPEPPDHVVIVQGEGDEPNFTWGDHRRMAALLAELEDNNPEIAAARARLDSALEDIGWTANGKVIQICSFCHQPENKPHEVECPDHNDPSMWVKREALAYEYLGPDFVAVHLTSVPMTDDEALEYFGIVELMFKGPGPHVKYITRKALDSVEFKMMPWYFDTESWEVKEIERPDES